MDLAMHPQFAQNNFVYMTYTKPLAQNRRTVAIFRGRWDGRALVDGRDIFVADAAGTSRIAFGSDGMLYMTTSGNNPQDLNTQGGKVLRLKDDGTVPPDNPFAGRANHKPEVYTLGHRTSLGLALHPGTGQMWLNENGPNGGDEINILKPGANYGWPVVSFGRTYEGPWQSQSVLREGFEPPLVYWMPSIAGSGMAFYTGDRFPKWKDADSVGAVSMRDSPATGHRRRV